MVTFTVHVLHTFMLRVGKLSVSRWWPGDDIGLPLAISTDEVSSLLCCISIHTHRDPPVWCELFSIQCTGSEGNVLAQPIVSFTNVMEVVLCHTCRELPGHELFTVKCTGSEALQCAYTIHRCTGSGGVSVTQETAALRSHYVSPS